MQVDVARVGWDAAGETGRGWIKGHMCHVKELWLYSLGQQLSRDGDKRDRHARLEPLHS